MQALRRKLLKRRVFVPWGSSSPFKVHLTQIPQLPDAPPPAPQVRLVPFSGNNAALTPHANKPHVLK